MVPANDPPPPPSYYRRLFTRVYFCHMGETELPPRYFIYSFPPSAISLSRERGKNIVARKEGFFCSAK